MRGDRSVIRPDPHTTIPSRPVPQAPRGDLQRPARHHAHHTHRRPKDHEPKAHRGDTTLRRGSQRRHEPHEPKEPPHDGHKPQDLAATHHDPQKPDASSAATAGQQPHPKRTPGPQTPGPTRRRSPLHRPNQGGLRLRKGTLHTIQLLTNRVTLRRQLRDITGQRRVIRLAIPVVLHDPQPPNSSFWEEKPPRAPNQPGAGNEWVTSPCSTATRPWKQRPPVMAATTTRASPRPGPTYSNCPRPPSDKTSYTALRETPAKRATRATGTPRPTASQTNPFTSGDNRDATSASRRRAPNTSSRATTSSASPTLMCEALYNHTNDTTTPTRHQQHPPRPERRRGAHNGRPHEPHNPNPRRPATPQATTSRHHAPDHEPTNDPPPAWTTTVPPPHAPSAEEPHHETRTAAPNQPSHQPNQPAHPSKPEDAAPTPAPTATHPRGTRPPAPEHPTRT